MENVVISLSDIVKTYTETAVPVKAVQGISLTIHRGEFTAIVGPSGCGKTTLLNLMGGLDSPTSGTVTIAGTDLNALTDSQRIDFRRQHIGFVFQAYNLIPVFTARENAEFVMLLQGKPAAERNARVDALLEAVGLADRAGNRPSQLSGGQQQRVAVTRALAPKPDFILADEPTANLDSASTMQLLSLMEQLNRDEQTTFVFSTHDQRVIDRAHRIIRLEDGRIASDETRK
jgi:putative ABC transport system ATP-binding protein